MTCTLGFGEGTSVSHTAHGFGEVSYLSPKAVAAKGMTIGDRLPASARPGPEGGQ